MRRLAPLALGLLLAAGAYAQRGGMGGGRGGMGGGGMGRGGMGGGGMGRGGFVGAAAVSAAAGSYMAASDPAASCVATWASPPPSASAFTTRCSSAGRSRIRRSSAPASESASVLRLQQGLLGRRRRLGRRLRLGRRFGYGGYGYPLYVGGGYGGGYAYDPFYSYPYYPAEPNITVIGAPYAAQPAPPVVVQAYTPPPQPVQSSIKEYAPGEAPREVARGTSGSEIYLLAFKDGVIRAALAYWVEGGTLHYVGSDRKNHEVPLTSINRDFSEQLNRERRVSFRLPEP